MKTVQVKFIKYIKGLDLHNNTKPWLLIPSSPSHALSFTTSFTTNTRNITLVLAPTSITDVRITTNIASTSVKSSRWTIIMLLNMTSLARVFQLLLQWNNKVIGKDPAEPRFKINNLLY